MKKTYLFLLVPFWFFGQEIISEDYELYNDDIYLPGTLSYPKSDKAIPLAIFIHGSGNADRNGNQGNLANAEHIKQLADSLNANGLAFYRFDKRNATPSNIQKIVMETSTIHDLVKDVSVSINEFGKDARFSSIYLIGHSQGSLVGMLAVSDQVSGYVSLAGPGTTVDKSLIHQLKAQNPDLGRVAEEHVNELMETDTIKEVHFMLLSIFKPHNQKYLKNWMLLNPANEIQKLKIPVLIINGDSDSQVTVQDAQLLKQAKPEASLVIIKKMNHMLKTVENTTENTASYTNPNFPLSQELVGTLVEFIKNHG